MMSLFRAMFFALWLMLVGILLCLPAVAEVKTQVSNGWQLASNVDNFTDESSFWISRATSNRDVDIVFKCDGVGQEPYLALTFGLVPGFFGKKPSGVRYRIDQDEVVNGDIYGDKDVVITDEESFHRIATRLRSGSRLAVRISFIDWDAPSTGSIEDRLETVEAVVGLSGSSNAIDWLVGRCKSSWPDSSALQEKEREQAAADAVELAAVRELFADREFRDSFIDGAGQGPEMVVLPSGSFTMGSPSTESGRGRDEGPQRTVHIDYQLAVGKYEVTFAEWDACSADGGCGGHRPGDLGLGRDNSPVINVNWEDAQSYVTWLNRKTGLTGQPDAYRLLSEAEWEYAARAGSQWRWSFGDDESRLGSFAWFGSNLELRTPAVGGKQPNAFGLYDMHGNVSEWVEDCYADSYSGAPSDGSVQTTPSCFSRVYRGGSWSGNPQNLRSAVRDRSGSGFRVFYLGFRLARTLP